MPHGLSAYPHHPPKLPKHRIQSGPSSIATESQHLDFEPARLVPSPSLCLSTRDDCFLGRTPPRLVVTPLHSHTQSVADHRSDHTQATIPTSAFTAATPPTTKHLYDVSIAHKHHTFSSTPPPPSPPHSHRPTLTLHNTVKTLPSRLNSIGFLFNRLPAPALVTV